MSSSDYLKLFRLVRNGDVKGLNQFLSTSDQLDLNHVNMSTHLTPLMVACNRPSLISSMIYLLIKGGAEIDYQTVDDGYSALMKAVENGNLEAVRYLTRHGAQVDLKNNRGKSTLEVGCEKGNVEVIEALLEVESDGDVQYSAFNTAFNTAVEHNHTKLVKWFLESGNITNIPASALSFAIDNQSIELVQLLLDRGAQVNLQNNRGVSALMLAVNKGNVEVVKELLERGADVNLKGEGGSTALLSILADRDVPQQSKIVIVNLLLNYHADVNIRDNSGFAPLRCALKSRSAEIVELLIDRIKDPVYQLNNEWCLFDEHVLSSIHVLKLCLDAGADPNFTDPIDDTPLLRVYYVDAAKMLIDYGANVNQRNRFGVSPILRAVEKSNYKLVELLLENGADITMSDNSGKFAKNILQRNPRHILRCLNFRRYKVQSEVLQYSKLTSLLETFINDQESASTRPGDIQESFDSRGTLPQRSYNADGEHKKSRGEDYTLKRQRSSSTSEERLYKKKRHSYDEQYQNAPDRDTVTEVSSLKSTVRSLTLTLASLRKSEKKFSIIVYGVSECPESTSKPDQSSHDFGEVASFLLKVDSSIQPQSIKDMHRLGKYHHERPRPRPILVKFIRSADVSKVLAKRSLIQPPYSVKPYLSKEEQGCESALLKERWSLIQSGTSRESIKIRLKDGVIMVDSKLYGKWDSTTNTLIKQ